MARALAAVLALGLLGPAIGSGAGFFHNQAWLKDLLFGGEEIRFPLAAPRDRGVYAIGNGRVFAALGLGKPPNMLSSICGPVYDAPLVGGLGLEVRSGGKKLEFRRGRIGWAREAAVVVSELEGPGFVLSAADFAPPGSRALVRILSIRATKRSAGRLEVSFPFGKGWDAKITDRVAKGGELSFTQEGRRKKRHFSFAGTGKDWEASRTSLVWRPARTGRGRETVSALALAAAWDGQVARAEARNAARDHIQLLERTRDSWMELTCRAAAVETSDPWVADFLRSQLYITLAQEAEAGGFAPMIGYTHVWVRDNNGPVKFLEAMGLSARAKRALDFFAHVAATLKSIPPAVAAGYSLLQKEPGGGFRTDLSETPSWLILQHHWHLAATGDLDAIRPRYAYLKHLLENQKFHDGKLFFQRDEPYMWDPGTRPFPGIEDKEQNYLIGRIAYSAEALMLYSAAAAALAEIATRLDKTRDFRRFQRLAGEARAVLEEEFLSPGGYFHPARSLFGRPHPAPHGVISFVPLWIGMSGRHVDVAFLKAFEHLWDGRHIYLTPEVGHNTGLAHGMALQNLGRIHHPLAGRVLESIKELASPSGDVPEIVDPDLKPWSNPKWGKEGSSGRVRPWEGALTAHAVIEALTGFEPRAHDNSCRLAPLPIPGQEKLCARRLRVGRGELSVETNDEGAPGDYEPASRLATCRIELKGPEPVTVRLEMALPAASLIRAWRDAEPIKAELEPPVAGGAWPFLMMEEKLKPGQVRTFHAVYRPARARLPASERVKFVPPAPEITSQPVVLFTSPWMQFRRRKRYDVQGYVDAARAESSLLRRTGHRFLVLDADQPLPDRRLAAALLGAGGGQSARLLIMGRDVLVPGEGTQKTQAFWNSTSMARTMTSFVWGGGSLIILDTDRAWPRPSWLERLAGAAPARVKRSGQVTAISGFRRAGRERVDELDFGAEADEKAHRVEGKYRRAGPLKLATAGKKETEDDGVKAAGEISFLVRQTPGVSHRIWLRHDHDVRPRLLVAVRKKKGLENIGTVRALKKKQEEKWREAFHAMPPAREDQRWARVVVRSENGAPFKLYRAWVEEQSREGAHPALAVVGWSAKTDFGAVDAALKVGKGWTSVLGIDGDPDLAALAVAPAGAGSVIRTTMPLKHLHRMIGALGSQERQKAFHRTLKAAGGAGEAQGGKK